MRTGLRINREARPISAALEELAHGVIGAAIEVHRTLGPGFLETVYEEAMAVELGLREPAFERQIPIAVSYKSHAVGNARLDLLIHKSVIAELKAVDALLPIHRAQVISYLKASQLRLGLLIDFNVRVLKDGLERIVL